MDLRGPTGGRELHREAFCLVSREMVGLRGPDAKSMAQDIRETWLWLLVVAVGRVLFPHACPFPCSLSGIIGERLPIRYYLTFGMLASGAFTALFGLGYFYNIHSLGFYVVTQVRACSRFTVRTGTVWVPKQELARGGAVPVQGHVSSCWLRNTLLPWHLDCYFLFQELLAWQVNEV